jgi:UDP-N-acetylglucosamine transferase subunit ALG13
MTPDELRSKYKTAYKIIARERQMREYVFAHLSQELARKLAEMDLLLEIVTALKDELKEHVGVAHEQGTLIDVPRKGEYA